VAVDVRARYGDVQVALVHLPGIHGDPSDRKPLELWRAVCAADGAEQFMEGTGQSIHREQRFGSPYRGSDGRAAGRVPTQASQGACRLRVFLLETRRRASTTALHDVVGAVREPVPEESPMRSVSAAVPIWLLLPSLAACPDDAAPPPDTALPAAEAAVCLQGEPFVADGTVPVDAPETGDANRVSELRWETHPGCERFVIDLAAEDETPASSAGQVRSEVLRDLGVVRVSIRDVEWVDQDATDAAFDGPLARAAYAMWSPDGRWIDVDLHLAGEAEAHVTVLDDPARVVVDLRPGGGPLPPPPATDDRVVVLQPRPGEASYPLTVAGYARTFEANVVARIERHGQTVEETFTTATAWADAWGHYSLTIDDGPTGPIVLHVGERSARDGTWQGAAVELNMR
jgi:hypothetical protein